MMHLIAPLTLLTTQLFNCFIFLILLEPALIPKKYIEGQSVAEYCRIENRTLDAHVFRAHTILSLRSCLLMCTEESRCLSVNYWESDQVCELNDNIDVCKPGDVVVGTGVSHYALRECA